MMIFFAAASEGSDSFWSANKDLLAFFISLVALAVSIFVARQSVKTTQQMARAATFQRIHELLVDPKAAAGRRRLFQARRERNYPSLGEEGWDEINYSLALYDTFGGYVFRGDIDEATALAAWHHPLNNITGPVREFMAHRRAEGVDQPWPYLMDLLEKSSAYTCKCPGLNPPASSSQPEPRAGQTA
jgi:hypothetical protein